MINVNQSRASVRNYFRLAHSSEPNSDRRRVGILFVFCPTHVKPTNELNSAILVRGKDEYGHWKSDPLPERDLDPANLKYYNDFWNSTSTSKTSQKRERTTAAE